MLVLTDELLLNYVRCARRSYLNLYGDRRQAEPEKEFVRKLRRENQQQIAALRANTSTTVVQYPRGDWQAGHQATLALMQQGVPRIERAVLQCELPLPCLASNWASSLGVGAVAQPGVPQAQPALANTQPALANGQPTFIGVGRPTVLVRQAGASRWGDWHYYPVNVKLGKRPKTEYKLIATFQAVLLGQLQDALPTPPLLQLRDGKTYWVDWQRFGFSEVLADCVTALQQPIAPEVFISRQRCSLCQWQTDCHAVALESQHLSLIPGITPSRYAALKTLGITELESLTTAQLSSDQLPDALPPAVWTRLQQQARSLFDHRALPLPSAQLAPPMIPQSPIELYFDLEAEPERQVDFLFGVLCVNHQRQTEQFYALTAQQPEEEHLIWQQFLALVDRYPNAPIYHFSPYEADTLRRLSRRYGLAHRSIGSLTARCVDIHALIVQSATLPVESYSLKAIAAWLGFQWRDQGLSGDQTVCLYDDWLRTGDRTHLDTIIRYNEDDCRATYKLKTWLVEFWQEQVANNFTEHPAHSKSPEDLT
ncbi:MAG: TM0106 family RecB-like putative nuclease [Cyanobacteria bacterium P01_G01_bin.54]